MWCEAQVGVRREAHVARGVGAHTRDGDRRRRGARRETRDTRDARRVRSDRVRREFFLRKVRVTRCKAQGARREAQGHVARGRSVMSVRTDVLIGALPFAII
jgi:hypothetical protein